MASFKEGDFIKIKSNCPYYAELLGDDIVLRVLGPIDPDGEHRCCVYEDGHDLYDRMYYPHIDYMQMVTPPDDAKEKRGIVAEECEIIYDARKLRVGDIVLILPEEESPDEYYLGFVTRYSVSIAGMDVINTQTGKKQYISPANIADGLVRYVHNSFDIYKDINIY